MLLPSCYRPRKWWKEKTLKLQPQSFNPPQPKAARPLPIFHRVLVLPKQSFNEFIRHQVQALSFASFCQEKEESPSAASRGKAAQRGKVFSRWWHQPIDECYKKKFLLRFRLKYSILSWPDGPFFFWQQKKQNCRLAIFLSKLVAGLGLCHPKKLTMPV